MTNMTHMFEFEDLKKNRKMKIDKDSILGFLDTNDNFKIFKQIVLLSQYGTRLNDKLSNTTIFIAPDNYIIDNIQKQFIDNIDEGMATTIIRFCTMDRRIDKNLLISSPSSQFTTRNSSLKLYVENKNNKTYISDGVKNTKCKAEILQYNLIRNNGIIHVIDNLMYPTYNI